MVNVNLLYTIGSIYNSVNSKNPSEIFGGTWERIKGKMLLVVDEDDQDFSTSGKTGGEKEHTLIPSEIPKHHHQCSGAGNTALKNGAYTLMSDVNGQNPRPNFYTGWEGGDQPHNNMPPYYTVYIWYRTA